MATRNLFRFVSVRPPISAAADDACRLINKEAGAQFVEQVLALQRRLGGSLQVARRAVSVGFIESTDYFVRSETWTDLRRLRRHFQDLVAEACRTEEEPGEDADVEGAPGEIEPTFGDQVRWVVDSESFANAKLVMWYSYYASALAPDLRPNDRPEMLDWIRLLAAFERLRPSSENAEWRYDAEGCACVKRLSRARVNMPHELFTEVPPPPDRVPDKPEDPVTRDIVALHASLERLHEARRNLDRLYRRKVNALRLARPPDRERGDAEVARPQRAEAGDDVEATTGAGPRRGRPPWLLTEEDVDQLPDLSAELDRLGIPLAGSLVPELASALDEAIAADTAALVALESRVDILGIGPTMTLARRTVRGFRPAPHGGAGSENQARRKGEEGSR